MLQLGKQKWDGGGGGEAGVCLGISPILPSTLLWASQHCNRLRLNNKKMRHGSEGRELDFLFCFGVATIGLEWEGKADWALLWQINASSATPVHWGSYSPGGQASTTLSMTGTAGDRGQ